MNLLQVALLQISANGDDMDANMAKGEAFCRMARRSGADVALFPEMWNTGYTFPNPGDVEAHKSWQQKAISPQHPFFKHFQELARSLYMVIGLTYLEQWQGAPRNSISLIDRNGNIALTYAKVHTCDFDREADLTPGADFPVCTLDTSVGALRAGAMICFDREFPESARALMLGGAEIILAPNACTMELNRIGQLRARAFENMTGIALANYPSPQANGHSLAFDGIAFDENGSRDMLLIEAGEQEGIYLARFDIDRLRAYRTREVWGNAYRKPQAYGALSSLEAQAPFQRVDNRR